MREEDRVAIGKPVLRLRLRRGAGLGGATLRSAGWQAWSRLRTWRGGRGERARDDLAAGSVPPHGGCWVRAACDSDRERRHEVRRTGGPTRARCLSHEPSCELRLDSCVHDSDVDRPLPRVTCSCLPGLVR